MQHNILQVALDYAKRGFSVIPVRPDKKPFIPWIEFQTRRATPEEITAWFTKWPSAMIGICTGEISGVFVVDCDNEEAYQKIQELLPDSFITCIAKTPRGYHLYLIYPEGQTIGNAAGILPGVDVRGQGGYVVAPGSVNAEGKPYEWVEGLAIGEVEVAPAPNALSSALLINNKNNMHRGVVDSHVDSAIFEHGRRDESLFHIALSLAKTGNSEAYIRQTLTAIISSWGESDKTWINAKVESAFKRISTQERNLAQEVREFVLSTSGYFSSTEIYNCLQLSTREERKNISIILKRLCIEGLIEKFGNRNGQFRRLNNEIEPLDWQTADVNPLNLKWPFGIHNLVNLYPGNIGIIAGYPNAGKTAFIHNFIQLNQNQHDVHLFSSEGGPEELRMRLSKFDCPLSAWKFKAWERSGDFADVVKPDAVNVIDYLELHDDFYKIGGMIKAISDRLKNGFALIAIQKNGGRDEGLGGARGLEKPRLYMAMDSGRLKIVKAKSWVDSHNNPNGQVIKFKLFDGCSFKIESRWEKE